MEFKQIDCFRINMIYLKYLAVGPGENCRYYKYYSYAFVTFFIILYVFLYSLDFYFMPRQIDIVIGELILYFTELSTTSKVLTFMFMRDKIVKLLDILECNIFQPDTEDTSKIVEKAKLFIIRYWKIVAVVSYTSHVINIVSPVIAHLLLPIKLELPVCSYVFLPDSFKDKYIYLIYLYQTLGIHFSMLYNVNIDTFFIGLMTLTIAQLNVLDVKLRRVTEYHETATTERTRRSCEKEEVLKLRLNNCIVHFEEVSKFCRLIEDVFSVTLFVQFSMASCIICICLIRFTMPAPASYYAFLAFYVVIMIMQIIVPCWFGTRVMDTSKSLSISVYNCDWTPRPRQFKSSLRLFVERVNRPLSITGGKMFPLSLATFTSIMNSAYSFFTLLQNVQSR